MKFLISMILIALLSVATCLYLPWWTIAIDAFIVAVCIRQKPAAAFFTGFTSLLFLWGALSWYLSVKNEHLLAHKVSVLILKVDQPYFLIAATAIVGAFVAGFASLAGSYLRK